MLTLKIFTHRSIYSVCVCVSLSSLPLRVCVCVYEREKEDKILTSLNFNLLKASILDMHLKCKFYFPENKVSPEVIDPNNIIIF